jgi:hypothetical protein
MESYDALGKLQTTDPRGGAIDSSVTTGNVMFGGGTVKQVSSPAELMRGIAESPDARKLYAQAWVAYAFGRDPNGNDQCVVDQLDRKLAQNGYSILGLLADLTQADSFRVRVRQAP